MGVGSCILDTGQLTARATGLNIHNATRTAEQEWHICGATYMPAAEISRRQDAEQLETGHGG
jgi:hypothetical protein